MSLPFNFPLIPDTPVLKTTYESSGAVSSTSGTPQSLLMPTSATSDILLGPPRLNMKTKKNRAGNRRLPLVSKDNEEESSSKASSFHINKKRSFLLSTAPLVPDASLEEEKATNGKSTIPLLPSCRLRMRPTKKIARTPNPYPGFNTNEAGLLKAPPLRPSTDSNAQTKRRSRLQLDPCSLPSCLMFPEIPTTGRANSSSNGCPRFSLKPKPLKRAGEATSTTNEGMLLAKAA